MAEDPNKQPVPPKKTIPTKGAQQIDLERIVASSYRCPRCVQPLQAQILRRTINDIDTVGWHAYCNSCGFCTSEPQNTVEKLIEHLSQ